ncbi:MAG: YfaZ family protein [Gammaproteobacteria bacterium]|nr:YfaZ family protein [Gammaproteobacteria bacterium]
MKKILLIVLLVLPATAMAKSIDLSISDDSFRFVYAFGIDKNLVTDLGFLYMEKEGRFSEDELAFHAGINFVSGNVRFGGRAFFVTPGDTEALAVGFGMQALFPLSKHIGLGGEIYYAPELTSFMDAEGYHEYSIRLDFKLATATHLYLGYRYVEVSIGDQDNDVELDDNAMLGIKVFF